MPTIELIKSLEDRELTSGPGSWTGDVVWLPGPYYTKLGFLFMQFSIPNQEKQTKLQYPAFKAPPDKTIYLSVTWAQNPLTTPLPYKYYYLSDGINALLGTFVSYQQIGSWNRVVYLFQTPVAWNKYTSTLTLKAQNLNNFPVAWCLDDFSLIYTSEAKPDHLPLMGVH